MHKKVNELRMTHVKGTVLLEARLRGKDCAPAQMHTSQLSGYRGGRGRKDMRRRGGEARRRTGRKTEGRGRRMKRREEGTGRERGEGGRGVEKGGGKWGGERGRHRKKTHFLRSCTTEVAVEESSPVVGSSR